MYICVWESVLCRLLLQKKRIYFLILIIDRNFLLVEKGKHYESEIAKYRIPKQTNSKIKIEERKNLSAKMMIVITMLKYGCYCYNGRKIKYISNWLMGMGLFLLVNFTNALLLMIFLLEILKWTCWIVNKKRFSSPFCALIPWKPTPSFCK